jgi:hypothetical protein
VIVQRVFAALAAFFLVGAVALATFGARAMTLEVALRMINRGLVDALFAWTEQTFGTWAWTRLAQPLLVRPAWLPAACLGLIALGVVFSLSYRAKPGSSHRRGK